MFNKSILTLATLLALGLAACSGKGSTQNPQFGFLDSLVITIDEDLTLGDSLVLPDIYCGDPNQTNNDLRGPRLSNDQYKALVVPASEGFADAMSNWLMLGARDMGNGVTLVAYYACNGSGYCVDLMTYDKQGHLLDAINAREMHLLWRVNLSDASNDTVFTLDGHFTFAGDKVTLHRTMGRCVMDFDGDLKGAPLWQQTWEQPYTINAKGHFVLQGQQVVKEKGEVDQYAALDFKAWDLLVCSLYDPGAMDTWNQYAAVINATYDPDYKYNPFPWDVAQLYRKNPQRFLKWLSAPANRNNNLLPCFKLKKEDRPALRKEIARIDDPAARQWLTALVNSWDDVPLTQHL